MNIFHKITALALSILAFCCGKPPALPDGGQPEKPAVIEFHGDTEFTSSERDLITQSAMTWAIQTNNQAKITIRWDLDFMDLSDSMNTIIKEGNILVKLTSDMPSVKAADCEADMFCRPTILGWTTSGGIHSPDAKRVQLALISDRFDSDNMYKQVVIHEMGHALGLPHVGSRQALMYPSIVRGRKACLKQPDLQAFCSVNQCTKPVYPCE